MITNPRLEYMESNSISVDLIRDEEAKEWESYVEKNQDSTFYHKIEWKRIIEKSFRHKSYYLIARREQEVVGILPIIHIRSIVFGSIFCSMPFLNFGGVCADSEESERALLNEAEKVLKNEKGDYLELRHIKKSSLNYLTKTHKVSMTLELAPDPEVLWTRFTTKHRTTVRRAEKNGLELRVGKKELLKDFYFVMCQGWRALGTPLYAYSFFENVVNDLEEHIEINVVFHRGQPIAAAMNGFFKDTVEGMWLASLNEYSRLQTGYFLYWEMVKRACEKGFRHFHLGRSTADGGGDFFKKKWNAAPKQLYWEYVLNQKRKLPELNVENSKYQLAMKMWRNLPLPVTRWIGPFLARSIP